MKKPVLQLIALTFILIISILSTLNMQNAKAESSGDYAIENVNHTVEVLYNGYILINDTVKLRGTSLDTETLDYFLIGFPYIYGSNVLRCMAYAESEILNVTLDVPLDNHIGFYAAEIRFPQPLDISNGTTHEFTVAFILSNELLTQDATDTTYFTLDYPAYPSLTKTAEECSVTVILPETAVNVTITKEDETLDRLSYSKENLSAFTYSPAIVTFYLAGDDIKILDFKELKREIKITEMGEIECSDSYYVTNKAAKEFTAIEIILPPNASNPTAQDQFGRKMQNPTLKDEATNQYSVTLDLPLKSYNSTRFSVNYRLPSQAYMNAQEGSKSFNLTNIIFKSLDCYIEKTSLTITLPEGARVLNPEEALIGNDYSLARNVFQETITINRQNVSPLESILIPESTIQLTYEYNLLWLSFRPTLIVWALTVAGLVVALVWKRPKAPTKVAVPAVALKLHPELIKSFVDSYEEKRKITLDIASLEERARKGKIPRRRYKVQRVTLETRIGTLSRSLNELKERMRAAGGVYADLMRQLEIAETEINEVESNIKSIEARYTRGDLSLEAYRKLLADYQRRKEKADTTISGILLRLREEIR